MVKRAFTLIELIFAIVVLSVAFLALPQLFESTFAQTKEIAKDEATFYGFKALQNVYRYYWDDKSEANGTTYILDVTNGDSELDRLPGKDIGRGQASFGSQAINRRFYDSTTYASATLGAESGESSYDDIDDFDGQSETTLSTIVDINATVNVYYISDSADYSQNSLTLTLTPTVASASTNIKMIEVNVTSNGETILLYRMFASNIGTRKIKSRELK